MKSLIIASLLALCPLLAPADDHVLHIGLTSGQEITVHTSEISRITVSRGESIDDTNIHTFNAPLYWSPYEKLWKMEQAGIPGSQRDITAEEWDEVIDWVSKELLPYGYDMICTDGFLPRACKDGSPYVTHYGSMPLKELAAKCKAKGLKLGVYDNPLWTYAGATTPVPGTNLYIANLLYDMNRPESPEVNFPDANDRYKWIVPQYAGAREYIDGFFQYYKEMGVEFIRMDFLDYFEDGYHYSDPAKDETMYIAGKGYGREAYELGLRYIAESAHKRGIFTSLVMPTLKDDAELEARYGNMFRVVADTYKGGWGQLGLNGWGKAFPDRFPTCKNMFDGHVYWSHLTGPGKVIPDGDFIRLNTFTTDAERQMAVTLQVVAGGPVAVADWPDTIDKYIDFYRNKELLALNAEGFVAKPLSDVVGDDGFNRIWVGRTANGDYIVAVFNRYDNQRWINECSFESLGIPNGRMNIRDLWLHDNIGAFTKFPSISIEPHGVRIFRVSPVK